VITAAVDWDGPKDSAVDQADRPSRIPRSICSLCSGLRAGYFSWQLQARPPKGFGSVPPESGPAIAGTALPTQRIRVIAALTSIFMIFVDAESTCHPFFEASDAGNGAPIGPGAFPAPMCNGVFA
jgi:hypothetical protein